MHITKFITKLNKGQKDLERNQIDVTDKDKLEHFVLQMFGSNLFDENQMMEWEKKAALAKTWAAATSYFNEIVKEQEMYSKLFGRSTKKLRYESAAVTRDRESGGEVERKFGSRFRR